MKKLIHISILFIILTACNSSTSQQNVEGPVFEVENTVPEFTFNDQFGNSHEVRDSIERLLVALDQETAHSVNDFLADKPGTFLQDNKTLFIADVSAAPGIIRKMFIMPGLKKFDYPVLIFTDEKEAKPFRMGVNTEKVLEVSLNGQKIISIKEHEPTVEAVASIF